MGRTLLTVEMFAFTNVPFGLWIDEAGTIVRPGEMAFPSRGPDPTSPISSESPFARAHSSSVRRALSYFRSGEVPSQIEPTT